MKRSAKFAGDLRTTDNTVMTTNKRSSRLPSPLSCNGGHAASSQDARPEGEVFISYAEKLKDPRWQRKRLEVMKRDDFTCRDCQSKEKTLNVHHCYYAKGGPWMTPDEYLLTLCMSCHKERAEAEEVVKTYLALKLARFSKAKLTEFSELTKDSGFAFIPNKGGYDEIKRLVSELSEFFPK